MLENRSTHHDNAGGELKNVVKYCWASWCVSKEKQLYDVVDYDAWTVGHTHGPPDQRFAVCGIVLRRKQVVEASVSWA